MEAEVRPLRMTEELTDLVTKYWQDVWERKREGGLVAWCSGAGPHVGRLRRDFLTSAENIGD